MTFKIHKTKKNHQQRWFFNDILEQNYYAKRTFIALKPLSPFSTSNVT